jgi:hypothetical protein
MCKANPVNPFFYLACDGDIDSAPQGEMSVVSVYRKLRKRTRALLETATRQYVHYREE